MASMGTFAPKIANPASDKQMAFLIKLSEQMWDLTEKIMVAKGENTDNVAEDRLAYMTAVEETVISKRDASIEIDSLLNTQLPAMRRTLVEITPPAPKDLDGIYYVDGEVIKCQYSGAGRLYAKVLDPETRKFEYTPGAQKRCEGRSKMTLEEAQEFGQLYGVCADCGRVLTNEESIAYGIGPICRGKY